LPLSTRKRRKKILKGRKVIISNQTLISHEGREIKGKRRAARSRDGKKKKMAKKGEEHLQSLLKEKRETKDEGGKGGTELRPSNRKKKKKKDGGGKRNAAVLRQRASPGERKEGLGGKGRGKALQSFLVL